MPLQDVTVIIDIKKPASMIGLGKPLIFAKKTGAAYSYKNYAELEAVKVDHVETTDIYKKAAAIFGQGDYKPREIAVVVYDPTHATAATSVTQALDNCWDEDWYFLVSTATAQADIIAIADYVEAKGFKIHTALATTTTIAAAIKAKAYDRTFTFFHDVANEHPDAAVVGAVGSKTVGSVTWKFKKLVGITPLKINRTKLNEIHAAGAICYVEKGGNRQTSEGKMASGEYIDVMHSKDWVKVQMENRIQHLMSTTDKLPYDNRGIGGIEGVCLEVLKQSYINGIIAENEFNQPIYSTSFLTREQVDITERGARVYNGGRFSFDLAGAIHDATIKGEIIV
jgi:hypothetical protein